MEEVLAILETPIVGEDWKVYTDRMIAIHGDSIDVKKAIRRKFMSAELGEE